MPNLIDFYKGISLHVIPLRIIVRIMVVRYTTSNIFNQSLLFKQTACLVKEEQPLSSVKINP